MDALLESLGCSERMALPGDARVLLGGHARRRRRSPARPPSPRRYACRGSAPPTRTPSSPTPPSCPATVWQPLQAKRVRYFYKPPPATSASRRPPLGPPRRAQFAYNLPSNAAGAPEGLRPIRAPFAHQHGRHGRGVPRDLPAHQHAGGPQAHPARGRRGRGVHQDVRGRGPHRVPPGAPLHRALPRFRARRRRLVHRLRVRRRQGSAGALRPLRTDGRPSAAAVPALRLRPHRRGPGLRARAQGRERAAGVDRPPRHQPPEHHRVVRWAT